MATLNARYIRGNGLVAREDEQGKAYYLHNGHGDVVGLMDASGKTRLNSYSYDIWGNLVSQQETVPQPFKYSGELWDNTTGLQYLRARWYDPSMGRFVNEDTYEGQIDNPLSLNLYTYVHNNPLTHTDPTGHIIAGIYVGINIDNARRYGSGSQLYWDVRSNLGSQAKSFFPGANYDDNNQFKFLYGVATMTSDYTELNNELDANWARNELVTAFQEQYEADLSFMDGLVAFMFPLEGTLFKANVATVELRRPYIRKSIVEEVESRAPRTADGKFIDPNTGLPIEGKYDLGHKPGHEFWREKLKAEQEGLTQTQFNDRMNNADYYQIEDPSSNRSRKYEMP